LVPPVSEFAPKPAIEDIGRLTAAAVNEQHEQAAAAIARLGETIKDLTRQHETALAELDATARLIQETAEKYIALGLEKSDLISKSAAVMADVKQTCADVMEKIKIPSVS
jgi:transposase